MNIKELRNRLGLSQQELADKTGIPRPRIAKWEEGKGNPKREDYLILEKLLVNVAPGAPGAAEPERAYQSPLDKIADSNQMLARSIERMVSMLETKEAVTERLEASLRELRGSLDVVAAYQKAYQEFWCEFYPPKNLKPQAAKDMIRDKAALSFQKQKP